MKVIGLHNEELEVVVVDYETYYDKDFSLRKITTTAYVRDDLFKALGASVKIGDGPTTWVTANDLQATLDSIDWTKSALLCHNTYFDGFILQHIHKHVPAYYLDTLSMSRGHFGSDYGSHSLNGLSARLGIGQKIAGTLENLMGVRDLSPEQEEAMATYAIQDADLTYKAFEILQATYPKQEMDIIHLTVNAYCNPVLRVNHALCEEERMEEARLKNELLAKVGYSSTRLMSNQQFAQILRKHDVKPPMKVSPSTGEATFAFSKADLEFQALRNNPRVSDLIKARMAVKSTLKETRAQRLIEHSQRGPLPVMLHYCGARTFRWTAGDKVNLQNLPSGRDGTEPRLRQAICAPAGHRLVVIDSSQIEARTLAWLAGQTDLLDVFRSGGDPYCVMASEIYGRPITKIDKTERALGKCAVLGLGYGMGSNKFCYTVRAGTLGPAMDISEEDAVNVVSIYRSKNRDIKNFWYEVNGLLERLVNIRPDDPDIIETLCNDTLGVHNSKILMPNGLWLRYQGLRKDQETGDFFYQSSNGISKIYGAKLVEHITQSAARSIVAEQAAIIGKRYRIVLLVHDEIVLSVPEAEAEEALAYGLKVMSTPPKWCSDLPLGAEGGHDVNYTK